MKMKRTILVLAILALAAVVVLLPGCRKQQDVKVFRLADNHPDGYPTVMGDIAFADYVREHSNGKIDIQVFNNSVLGQEREAIEMTQTGAIHFIRVGINPLTSLNPQLYALGMPYLFRDREHMFQVLDGPIGDEIRGFLVDQNLYGLCWFDAGFRNFYNSQKEIRTPADMRGMKIRVQESALMMDMIRFLGASPTPMAYGEIYTSIQNGIVEGAENNWPSYISAGHYEVAKFFTVSQHMASPEMILINTATWDSFTDEEKEIVLAGAVEGARVEREEWLKAEIAYEAQARASGNTITELTPEEFQLFADALAPLYDQPAYTPYAELIRRIREAE